MKRLLPDTTSEDVDAFMRSVGGAEEGPRGPPPFDFGSTDGIAVIDGGMSMVTEIELKEGKKDSTRGSQERPV